MAKAVKSSSSGAVLSKDGSFMYGLANALRGGRFASAVLLIALFAFALRLGVSWDLLVHDTQVANPSGLTDMWTYKDLAERIVKGEYQGEFYYQPFYYAVFLPLSHFLFGSSIWAVLIVQALAGAGAVLFAGLAAALLWGRIAGLLASLLASFSAALLLYTPYHLIETSQAFWLTLLLFLALRAFKKGGALRWAAAGFVLSIAILTRGNAWIFAPGLLLACAWSEGVVRGRPLKALLCALALLFMSVAPQAPFIVRNSVSCGELRGPSTAAAAVLSLGNTPEAPPGGRNPGYGPGPMEYPPTYQIWMDKSSAKSPQSRIVEWAKSEPLAFLELSFRKALLFWDAREIPNNIAFEYNGAKSRVWKTLGLVSTGIILSFALAGALATIPRWRKKPAEALLVYFVAAYWLAAAAFYILARFRVPILPLCCSLSAGFLVLCLRDALAKNWRRLLVLKLGALLLGLLICHLAYDAYRFGLEAKVMKIARPDGVRVEASPYELMTLDNGPESFGSWAAVKLEPEQRFVKSFSLPKGESFSSVRLEIASVWNGPGGIILSVNGHPKAFKGKNVGLQQLEFEMEAPADGQFDINILRVDADASLLADLQRDYGRTSLNGKPLGGELVMRAWFKKKN